MAAFGGIEKKTVTESMNELCLEEQWCGSEKSHRSKLKVTLLSTSNLQVNGNQQIYLDEHMRRMT